MGIVLKQSFINTIIIYLSFVVGALNNLIFYPTYLKGEYHGIIVLLFSYSNIIMPMMAFGIHYTIVKFFPSYKDNSEKDKFLTWALFFPLIVGVIVAFFWNYIHEYIVTSLITAENKKIEDFTITIYIIAICCAYFEIFYAWSKVHFKTVFGNILKEFWLRFTVLLALVTVYFDLITKSQFVFVVAGTYILRTLVMMFYAFRIYLPKIQFRLPNNYKELLRYSAYIILAGSAGAMLLDIDKLMIPSKEAASAAAYYAVAVYIGSFIEAPSRAMTQILQPLTSKSLQESNFNEVESLYKKSSINLMLIGGMFFLLVNCGISELYKLIPSEYSGGEIVILIISAAKLYTMSLGNNNAIITNSKFYRIALPLALGSAFGVYFLNKYLYFDLNFGTDGLALSTLIIVLVFNSLRLWFVSNKFNMLPFTKSSLKMAVIIVLMFGVFYFWNFQTSEFYLGRIPIHPIINIVLKSVLIVALYVYIVLKLKISDQFTNLFNRLKNKVF